MRAKFLLILTIMGLVTASVVYGERSGRQKRANFKSLLRDILDIADPLTSAFNETRQIVSHIEDIEKVLTDDMDLGQAAQVTAAQIYSKISHEIDRHTDFPEFDLGEFMSLIELEKYVGDHLDLDRIAGVVQPFISSPMSFEEANMFLVNLYDVVTDEASGVRPEILLTALKGGLDKVTSLGEIDPHLTTFIRRARNIYEGIIDKKTKDIFMEVIAVQIHDMIMIDFLPLLGVRDINITAEIQKLGVTDYIGQVDHLGEMVARVQPLLSRNLTLNETIAVFMRLYDFIETRATTEVDFRALKGIAESLVVKTEELIPDFIADNDQFEGFLQLAKDIYSHMDKTRASEFSGLTLGNLVYDYVIAHVFPLANVSHVNISAVIEQFEVDKHVKGVVSVKEMARLLQPVLQGELNLEESLEVFTKLYQLIEDDANRVSPNTIQLMAENLLHQYQSLIPSPEQHPAAFRELLTRIHHTYLYMPDGEVKDYFRTVLTNTIFEQLTHLKVSNKPRDIQNLFNKDDVSDLLGVDVAELAAVFRPLFDGKLDLEEVPFIFLNAFRLFTNDSFNVHIDRIEQVFRLAMQKLKIVLPDPVNNNAAYKKLLTAIEQIKKSLSPQEGELLTAIFGELGGNASSLVRGEVVRERLGQGFNVERMNGLIQPILDGTISADEIPATFSTVYTMVKAADEDIGLEQLVDMLGEVPQRLMVIVPDPYSEPAEYRRFRNQLNKVKASLDVEGRQFLSRILDSVLNGGLQDLGLEERDIEDVVDRLDDEALQVVGDIKRYKNVIKLEGSSDDIQSFISRARDVGRDTLTKVMNFAGGMGQMAPTELRQVPPELFDAMDPSSLRSMASRFTPAQTDSYCETILDTDGQTAQDLMAAVDCGQSFTKLRQTGAIELGEEFELGYIENRKKAKSQESWTGYEWTEAIRDFPGGLGPDDYDKIPASIMLANIELLGDRRGSLDEDSVDEVLETIGSTFGGDYSRMDGAILGQMGDFIDDILPEDLEKISPIEKLEAIAVGLKDLELDDAVAVQLAEDVLPLLPAPGRWSARNLQQAADMVKYDEELVSQIPIDTLASALPVIGAHHFDATEVATFAERLFGDPVYQDPGNWGAARLSDGAALVSAAAPDFIRGLDKAEIMMALDASNNLANTDFTKTTSRELLKKIKSQAGELNPEVMGKMGNILKSILGSDVTALSTGSVVDSLRHFLPVYHDLEASTQRYIINKLSEESGVLGNLMNQLGGFISSLSMDQIDALPYDQIEPTKLSPNDSFNALPSHGQAFRLYDNLRSRLGSPRLAPGNWTMNMWRYLGHVICGIPCSDIENLPTGKKLLSIFKLLADKKHCLDGRQLRCMASRLKTLIWNTTSDEPLHPVITKTTIAKYGRFLAYFNNVDLGKFNDSLCDHIIRVIGRYPLNNLPYSRLVDLNNYAHRCTDIMYSGSVRRQDFRLTGDIMCGLEVSDIGQLDARLFKKHFKKLSRNCDFPEDVEKRLLARATRMMNIVAANITVKDLVLLGPTILSMSESDLKSIPPEILHKAAARLLKGFTKKTDKIRMRKDMGMPVSDKSQIMDRFYRIVIDAVLQKKAENSGTGRRRKRDRSYSSELTCSDLKKLGAGVTSLSTSQLDIDVTHFSSCADFLGTHTAWSDSQKKQLSHTAISTWGSPQTWSTSTLISAGTITQGLSDQHLSSLNINTIDAISILGKYTGWTSTQLSTLFSVWLSGTRNNQAANIDDTDLHSIGEFACGATTSHIADIPPLSYKGAAHKIGSMSSCVDTQLAAYATLAKSSSAFGPASSWVAATVAIVGNVIGGLSASEISALTQTQIEALSLTAISTIPNTSFRAFSTSQLRYFSVSQANSVTPTQMSALSAAHKAALSAAGAVTTNFVLATDPPSSASSMSSSFHLTLLLLILLQMRR